MFEFGRSYDLLKVQMWASRAWDTEDAQRTAFVVACVCIAIAGLLYSNHAKITFSIGLLMNSFLIFAVVANAQRSHSDFRVQNVFIVNLAVSDLCLGE